MRILCGVLMFCLVASACRNVPAEQRENLRREVEITTPENRDELRLRLRVMLVGDDSRRPDADPHLRAGAAQGLGNLGDGQDFDVLLEAMAGPLADENLLVRMESAIALGKLNLPSARDERRRMVVRRLRDRTAFERDDRGRPRESEALVRMAMLNSLIGLGGRDAASALHDIAGRLNADMRRADSGATADIADKGLLDRALEGLRVLTGASREETDRHRRESDDLEPHLLWFARRIAMLPES